MAVQHTSRSRIRPRVIMSVTALAVATLAFAACSGGTGNSGGSDGDSGGTVTIGVINQFGQPGGAESADDWQDGANLGVKYIEENGGLFNGARIKFNEQPESGTQDVAGRILVEDAVQRRRQALDRSGADGRLPCRCGTDRSGRCGQHDRLHDDIADRPGPDR